MPDNQKFGKRLVQAGVIIQEQLEEAIKHQGLEEGRLGELLVRLGYVSESTILQFLAAEFRTRYVSTERLARARIPQQVLDLLPVQLAERYNLIPVLYDTETQTLSVVTSEPQNEENLREVHMLTSVRELRVYVALQPAVQAAIRKHYRGEINAFKELLFQDAGDTSSSVEANYVPADNYPTNSTSYVGQSQAQDWGGQSYANPYESPAPYNVPTPYENNYNYGYNSNSQTYNPNYHYEDPSQYPTSYENAYQDNYEEDATRLHANPYIESDTSYDPNQYGYMPNNMPYNTGAQAPNNYMPYSPMANVNVLGLTRHLVQLLEQQNSRYSTHTENQRPVLETMLRRLNFSHEDAQPLWLAFYLHHSMMPSPHPCLLNLEPGSEEALQVQQKHKETTDLFEQFLLPDETLEILRHMYERVDGQGFPSQLKQEDIPLGSRLLALIDAYEEFSHQNGSLSLEEILTQLEEHKGTLFDDRLLGIFKEEQNRLEQYRNGTIPQILLLDPDVNLVAELESLLWEKGFWLQTAHNLPQAKTLAQNKQFDLVVLELDLGANQDALSWIERQKEESANSPEFIIITQRQDELDRGMALARDYLLKPMSANVIVAKLKKQLEQIETEKLQRNSKPPMSQGLAGSLEQLGIPEVLQVLSQSRRTGQLAISSPTQEGQIFLQEGEVVNAITGEIKGEQAFGHMMQWTKGEFSFAPDVQTDEKLINKRLDGLILDSFRMLDEANRDGVDDPFGFSSSDAVAELEAGDGEDFFDLALSDDDIDPSAQDTIDKP